MSRKAAVELDRKRKVQKVKDDIAALAEIVEEAEPVLEDVSISCSEVFHEEAAYRSVRCRVSSR